MKKKILFVLVATAFLCFHVHGGVGVKGGLNISNFNYSSVTYSPDLSYRNNFILGGFLNVKLVGPFSIQPEIFYSTTGAEYSGPLGDLTKEFGVNIGNIGSINISYRISYLEIPVLGRIDFDMEVVSPYIFAGPYYRKKLSEKVKFDYEGMGFTVEPEIFNESDMGITAGAGMEVELVFAMVLVEARYSLGMQDISIGTETIKNQVISVMVGIGL
jgi:hypothetical protein